MLTVSHLKTSHSITASLVDFFTSRYQVQTLYLQSTNLVSLCLSLVRPMCRLCTIFCDDPTAGLLRWWLSSLHRQQEVCVFLGDALISWKAKKQATISRSFTKAKYWVLASTISEVLWLTRLLRDFHVSAPTPAIVFCDNQSTIHIANNPVFHEWKKHIEIDCHFVRGKIDGSIKLLPFVLTCNS